MIQHPGCGAHDGDCMQEQRAELPNHADGEREAALFGARVDLCFRNIHQGHFGTLTLWLAVWRQYAQAAREPRFGGAVVTAALPRVFYAWSLPQLLVFEAVMFGHEGTAFIGGLALAACRRAGPRAPDLILSDYRLPGRDDGLAAIEAVCRHYGGCRV